MTPPLVTLPRRPLTMGELLDAAVQVLRGRPWALLGLAAGLAVVEQALLYPLRWAMGVDLINGFEAGVWSIIGSLWVVTAVGAGLEAMIINLLGPAAGRMTARGLATPDAGLAAKGSAALLTAPVHGLMTAAGAFLGPVWIFAYALFGVSGLVVGLERLGPGAALSRAAKLAFRGGMRVTWIRILGYLTWMLLRLGFLAGVLSLTAFLPFETVGVFWMLTVGFVIANTATYAYLAALDGCAVAESRFRSEGWDIWLSRQPSALTGAAR